MKRFNRILLKLSGESLMGEQGYGIDVKRLNEYAEQIKEAVASGVQIGIVIGGGKFLAGAMGTAPYASICGVTVLYTLIQFVHLGFCFKTDGTAGYTLFHLLLLFVYCAIVIPIGVMGINNKKD